MTNWEVWLGNGLPLIILLVGWFALMKGMGSGRWGLFKVQHRHNELLEQQIEALRQTNDLLKRLLASR